MAVLEQCPKCHMKQAIKNKLCGSCGEDLDKAKRSKKVKYWIHYRLPGGKQKWELVGNSIEEARDANGKRRTQKRENGLFDIKPDKKMTFRELSDWYLDLEEIKGKASYRQMIHRVKLLNEGIGNKIVSRILPVDLQNYREKRRKEGKALATIDDEVTQGKMIVNKAFENKMASADTLQTFMSVKNLLKTNANARDKVLTPDEFIGLYSHADIHLKAVLATGYYTGMRSGEILNLTWNKVDLKNNLIRLEAIDTKTGEPRKTPICDILHEILRSLPRGIHNSSVFLYKGRPMKSIKNSLKTACKKAGILYGRKHKDGFTYHDLRHTFNTYARKAGIDKEVIKAITGHKTDSMFSRYNKIDSDDIQKAGNQYQEFLNVNQTVNNANESKS